MSFYKTTLTTVGNGMWRAKKEQGDLAGATAGVQVRAGGLDQGAGRADGEKWLEPHISVASCYLHNKAQTPQSGIEGL